MRVEPVPGAPRPVVANANRIDWTDLMVSTALTDRLMRAKLRIPCGEPAVPRPRLVERIETGLRRPVTVVAAPAGSGKTTLLGAWARATRRAVAWLSLDA